MKLVFQSLVSGRTTPTGSCLWYEIVIGAKIESLPSSENYLAGCVGSWKYLFGRWNCLHFEDSWTNFKWFRFFIIWKMSINFMGRKTILRLVRSMISLSWVEEWYCVKVPHIYSEVNCVAHKFAHIVSCYNIYDFWFNETPIIIQDVLYDDFYN